MLVCIVALLVFSTTCGQYLTCGTGYLSYQQLGEAKNYSCGINAENISFVPALPRGLEFVSGTLRGSPTRSMTNLRFRLSLSDSTGYMWITSQPNLTDAGIGFKSHSVYSDVHIHPIRFYPNSAFNSFTIEPKLENGLVLDEKEGVIRGTYRGEAKTVNYTVTAIGTQGSASAVMTINYKDKSELPRNGYSLCYINYNAYKTPADKRFVELENADRCVRITDSIDFRERYNVEKVHRWPGLADADDFDSAFVAKISGYFKAESEGYYIFRINATNSVTLEIDDEIVINDGEIGSASHSAQGMTELWPGYHLLSIYYTYSSTDAALKVEWQSDTTSWATLDGSVLWFGSRGPAFLHYPTVSAVKGMQFNVTDHTVRMDYVERYTITPDLPSSIHFDTVTGDIRGVMNSPIYQVYTITAENAFGVATTEWTLLVDNNARPGLVGYYYSVDKDHDICKSPVTPQLLDLYTIRQDTSFNHPMEPRNSYWDGIPSPVFQGVGYIEWKGYMYVQEAGKWTIHTEHTDGVRMYIDDEIAINALTCNDESTTSYRLINLAVGYHKVTLQWFENHNAFQFIMKVKRPSDQELIPIPEGLFVHMPETVVTSNIARNQFYIGKPIHTVSFSLYGVQDIPVSYSISPDLPKGLSFTDGQLSGTPIFLFDSTDFEVTISTSLMRYTSTFNYAGYSLEPPSSVVITDSSGHPLTEVKWTIYKQIEPLNVSCGDVPCVFTIEPELPAGITFSPVTLQITGIPTAVIDSTIFTITATNEEKSSHALLDIVIPSCSYGHYYYVSSYSEYDMYIIKNGAIVQSYENVESGDYSSVLCLPVDTYQLALRPNPSSSWIFSISLTRDDNIQFFSTKIEEGAWFNTTWQMVQTEKPTLSIEITEYYVRSPVEVVIPYAINGLSKPLVINPPLSDHGMLEEKKITIPIDKPGKVEYTLTVENDVGRSEVVVTIYADSCPENTVFIVGTKAQSVSTDNFVLTREFDGKVVIRQSLGFDTGDLFNLCLENVPYLLTINTSGKENQPTRPVMLKDESGNVLGSFVLDKQLGEVHRLTWISLVQDGANRATWSSSRSVNKKWKEINFNERNWVANSQEPNSFSSKVKTVYFRYHAEMDIVNQLPVLLLDVKANGGFVMYINGFEVLRINLPSGTTTRNQMARRYVDLSDWTRVSVSSDRLQSGDNIIAVELHCYSTGQPQDEKILFEMDHLQLTSSIHFISDSGTATGSSHGESSSDGPEAAFFDPNDYTYWEDTQLPGALRFTFPNGEMRMVNRMVIRGNYNGMYQPIAFQLFGIANETVMNDDNEYVFKEVQESVLTVNNPYLFNGAFKDETFYLNPTRPYGAYEIVVHQTSGVENAVRINSIRFYYDHHYYCPEEKGWDRTASGSFTYGSCPWFNNGMSTRSCNATGTWNKVDRSTCMSRWAEKNSAFLDTMYRITNCTLEIYENNTRDAFHDVLAREMTVREENVLLYLPRRCENVGDLPAVCVNVRLIPHRLTSQYVKMELEIFNANATALFYKRIWENVPENMEIIPEGSIHLYERMTGKDVVVTIIIVVLALLCIILLVMNLKKNGGSRYANRKQLSKKSVQLQSVKKKEKEPLLEICFVCLSKVRTHYLCF